MSELNRRNFLKQSAIAGAALAFLPQIAKSQALIKNSSVDLSVATGKNYFENTIRSIEQLGGIDKFVSRNSKVGLLINAPKEFRNPYTHVNSDIIVAVLKLLNDAGAKDVICLKELSDDAFKELKALEKYKPLIDKFGQNSREHKTIPVPRGVFLKEVNMIKDLFDCDIYINLSIIKHHSGAGFTNSLKNVMGVCQRESCLFFHSGNKGGEERSHLSQCIADANLVRKPDLCIVDATEVLRTNGPFGPGQIIKPMKVYSGTDPVAVDVYGCTLMDYNPQEIESIKMANQHGIGRIDIENLIIKESNS